MDWFEYRVVVVRIITIANMMKLINQNCIIKKIYIEYLMKYISLFKFNYKMIHMHIKNN